jgi:hypothetical protein
MELTRERHAVVGVLTGLSFRVPYQLNIGTETQRLKNRTKHLCISLQRAIFLFAPRGSAPDLLNLHTQSLASQKQHIFFAELPNAPLPNLRRFYDRTLQTG